MARIAFQKIMAGLEDVLEYADGDCSRGTAHQVKVGDVDITQLREKLGLPQDKFASLFGLSVAANASIVAGCATLHPAYIIAKISHFKHVWCQASLLKIRIKPRPDQEI